MGHLLRDGECISLRVLLTIVPVVLFKHFKLENYSIKMSNSSMFNAYTRVFIKNYHLRLLKNTSEILVNISLSLIITMILKEEENLNTYLNNGGRSTILVLQKILFFNANLL